VARYSLRIKPSAVKEIEAIPFKRERQRLMEGLANLAENPRPSGCEKLSGQEKYRVRQGQYRILYSIDDQNLLVFVVKIGHREKVYR